MSKIFFSGIAGSGMSALASFMSKRGHIVSGSDRLFDRDPQHPLIGVMKAGRIGIVLQDGTGIDALLDQAVFSTAVEEGNPEIIRARQLGIPVKTRPECLKELVSDFRTIAVAGTSGKSTTAGMLAFLMAAVGLDPNFIGGGRVKQFKSPGNPGNMRKGDSDFLVFEACESDGSIIEYRPFRTIIGNLSLDHNSIERTALMFETLARNTKETVLVNGDDENLHLCRFARSVIFSIDRESEYQAQEVEYGPFGSSFVINNIPFMLSLPGKHNVYNAVSCIALLSELGVDPRSIAGALPNFAGIDRRFDIHLNAGGRLVIDDYAHNPHKISSLMKTVSEARPRVCYIFQPHGFGPTRMMRHEYVETFSSLLRKEDHLVLLPIYYAGGTFVNDISSEDLMRGIREAGRSVEVLSERASIFSRLPEWDSYVVFGARDETLSEFAEEIALRLHQDRDL